MLGEKSAKTLLAAPAAHAVWSGRRARSVRNRAVANLFLGCCLVIAGTFAAVVLAPGSAGAGTPATTWTQKTPATSPSARSFASMAYDPAIGKTVLFGGYDGDFGLADTWTWNGTTWTQLYPATSPPARDYASMAYDPTTGNVVLFGGYGDGALSDTWTFDGSNWTQQFPDGGPAARGGASMAYDSATGNMVLFGGYEGEGGDLSDTWVWDGSNWTEQLPGTSPPARDSASMAYDPASGNMVLFGGYSDSVDSGVSDTWVWDGNNWTEQSPPTSPAARDSAPMAYDPATGNMVLFGGYEGEGGDLSDAWVWAGNNWTELSPATSPGARDGSSMSYDPATGKLLLFGGEGPSGGEGYSQLADTWIYGSAFPGVSVPYSCTVSGFGSTTIHTVVSESPAPPSSVDAGGTFQTAPAAEVTLPAQVLNHFIAMGATSLTVASQSTAIDGRSSVGGPLSGAVRPNVEAASASNLPQSDTALVAGAPYTYDTTYNPVTFQTGEGTGKVYLTPGPISAEVTFVIHGSPVSESVSCTPPSGVKALGSTTVNPPPATPTFQVPTSTPPLQNQVSAGTDGGWGATVSNTSTARITGLTATVNVTDHGSPISYDLAGMAASGTNCSSAGSGKVTCPLRNLVVGASDSLDVLVKTSGLASGVVITGSATITSSNASSHATTLGSIGVVVVQSGSGTEAVAAPGIPVVSTKKPLKTAKASVTLTLPTKRIRKPGAHQAAAMALAVPLAGTTSTSPPPVAVTLKSLPASAEPALCPPAGSVECYGHIVQATGNFSAYTNKKAPIVAVLKFFYGLRVPAGTLAMLKPNGRTVVKLPRCTKSITGYNTPCVNGPEQTLGSAAHDSLYAQDTVYFTGADPIMGRRG